DTPLRRQIEPVLFLDTGGGKLKKTLPGERHSKLLTGVGGGFRVHINKGFYLRMEWAQYIGNEPEHGSGPSSFYLTFQSEI
ncbi:MAG: hypothetical protein NT079_04895, partial [Candidatus Omnitrophica bacterium]|nr:hypothetical protein [Candidatus Omnitrophota bacterium]